MKRSFYTGKKQHSFFRILFFPGIILLFFLTDGCKPGEDHRQEILQLDSALNALASYETKFLATDTSLMQAKAQRADSSLQRIGTDTLKRSRALSVMNAFEQVTYLKNLIDNHAFMTRALSEERKQLLDLKHDLDADLIEKNKAGEYVVKELQATKKLTEAVDRMVSKAEKAVTALDTLNQQLDHLADSLSKK